MYEGVNVEKSASGCECVVTFEQEMNLQGENTFFPLDVPDIRMEILPYFTVYMTLATLLWFLPRTPLVFYDMNSTVSVEEE